MKLELSALGELQQIWRNTGRYDDAAAYAIAARNLDRAQKFAKEWGFEKAYAHTKTGNDPEVELIYIATPHPFHIEHAKLCINHGKPVLCEKPFTVNAVGAKEVFALAKEKEVFITEAIWTRYLPSRKIIDDIIASGEIGEIKGISANLGYDMHTKERLIDPKLAGGALLDVGIYPLNFASMVLGDDVEETLSSCVKFDSGVDAQNSIILKYKNGSMASIQSSALTGTEQYGMIYGTKGYLIAENINDITAVKVYTSDREFVREITMPEQITGFEYEVRASMKLSVKENLNVWKCRMKKVFASWNRWMDLEKIGGLNIHLKKETDRASNYVLVIIISCPWQKVVLGQQYFE